MNTTPDEQNLIHANLLGFAVQCKQAGKTDADIPVCVKRAQDMQARVMTKRAKLTEAILGHLTATAPVAA
jgi:uncharacterized protein (DUF2252 family)